MASPYNLVDASGRFVANVILKKGRNELQIYHFSASSSPSSSHIIDETKTRRHETTHAIVSATWLNEHVVSKSLRESAKRKAAADTDTAPDTRNSETGAAALLAVAVASGDIHVFLPHAEVAVAKIQAPAPVVALTQSSTENCVWVLTETRSLVEINVLDSSNSRTVSFAQTDKDAGTLRFSPSHKKPTRGAESERLLVASTRLYLVDDAHASKPVLVEFADGDEDDRTQPIACLAPLFGDELSVLATRANCSTVALYDLEHAAKKPSVFSCPSRQIRGVRALSESLIAVFTDTGTELVAVRGDVLDCRVGTVRTNFKQINFVDMVVSATHGVVGIWYDGNEPRFVRVAADAAIDGEVQVDISYHPLADGRAEDGAPDILFMAEDNDSDPDAPDRNLAAADLFPFLRDRLTAAHASPRDVLRLCCRNNNETTIRDTIRLFSHSEQGAAMMCTLFQTVAREVARDPMRHTPLALWLKWLLLAHGGYISRQHDQEETLRALKESFLQGMHMMPKLLALQGRLQLLKSQADLRNKTNQLALDEDEDEDLAGLEDVGMVTKNNTTAFDDSVMYVNGENDDFEVEAGEVVHENGEPDAEN